MGNLVVKSNALVEASYSLDVVEQRIILLFILQARELGIEVTPLTKIKIYAESYAKYFGVTKEASYQALKQGVLGLHEQEFVFSKITGNGKKLSHYKGRFVDFIGYTDGEASIELVLGSQIVPHILELQQAFTSYEIEQARGLNRYGLRLYELLIRWKSTGKLIIGIDDLRAKMGLLKSEYQRIDNLKRWVIESALKEINTHTDLEATYTQQKSGRKITGFDFEFKYKKGREPKHAIENNAKVGFDITEMSDKQRAVFADKLSKLTELGERAPEGGSYADFARQIEQDLKDPKRAEFYRPYLDLVGFKPTKFSKPIIEQTKPSSEPKPPKPAKPLAITTSEPPQTISTTPAPIEPYSEPTQPPSRIPPQPPPYYYEQELDYYEQGIETYYDTEPPKRRTTITDVFKSYSDNEQAIIKKTTLAFIDRFNINADEATAVKKKAIIEAWGVRREPPSDYNPYYYNPYHDPY